MSQPLDMRDAFFDELCRLAEHDKDVILLTGDMGAFGLQTFRDNFPDQFVNMGIAEQNMIGVAAGLAMTGKRVFAYAIAPFISLRCLEQIKVSLCMMNLPVTLVGSGPGLAYGPDGGTHQGLDDEAAMRSLPNITIFNPSDERTARLAAHQAINGPAYVRLDKGSYPDLYDDSFKAVDGFSVVRTPEKVLIVTSGTMTHNGIDTAELLQKQGIGAGVIDLMRTHPIDSARLADTMSKAEYIVSMEEGFGHGGASSAVLEFMADNNVVKPVKRLYFPSEYPHPHGSRDFWRERCGLNAEQASITILEWCNGLAR